MIEEDSVRNAYKLQILCGMGKILALSHSFSRQHQHPKEFYDIPREVNRSVQADSILTLK